jgi:hypothetical protein
MAFVGRGETKAQVEFSACGKWNDVACVSTTSWGWKKNGATNPETCDNLVLLNQASHRWLA